MKKKVLEKAKEMLENEVAKKLHEDNFVKKLYDTNSVIGEISEEKLRNNEYSFGGKINIEWLREENLSDRQIKLHHVIWKTPLKINKSPQATIRNSSFQYVSGNIDDVLISWEFNRDGEIIINFENIKLEEKVELKRYN